jgi:hypothetical protein
MWVEVIVVVQVEPRLPFIATLRFTEPWGGNVKCATILIPVGEGGC